MTKFLNNKDGEHLKRFISDKVEAIISYPRKYFQEFDVTTVIVILKKGNNSANVSFVRVSDENVLLNPDNLKTILALNTDTTTAAFKLRVVPRNTLIATDNWRKYLNDNKYDNFSNLNCLVNIVHHFEKVNRGNSENDGGAKLIYPTIDLASNNFFVNGSKPNENRIDIPNSLNNYIGYGIKNNDVRRNYIFEVSDLEYDLAFHFPGKADNSSNNLIPSALAGNLDLNNFYNTCNADFGNLKWKRIINNSVNHTYSPKIIIPRADRTKHCVYFNPLNSNFILSTNFFYCDDLKNKNPNVPDEEQYKFITAFLLSAFGQIQFELNANNQEGLRKLEGFQIKKFRIPDLTQFTQAEILSVVEVFDTLNVTNPEFSGDEGLATPRRNLDLAIGNIVFSKDNLGFTTGVEMVDYFELFLADLVEDRRL